MSEVLQLLLAAKAVYELLVLHKALLVTVLECL